MKGMCIDCAVGRYKDYRGDIDHHKSPGKEGYCTRCKPNFTTLRKGAKASSQCLCKKGYFGPNCTPCLVDTYSDKVGAKECTPCRPGSHTVGEGFRTSANWKFCVSAPEPTPSANNKTDVSNDDSSVPSPSPSPSQVGPCQDLKITCDGHGSCVTNGDGKPACNCDDGFYAPHGKPTTCLDGTKPSNAPNEPDDAVQHVGNKMKLVFLGVLGGVIVVGFLVCSRRKRVAKRELDELLNGDDICRYAVPLLGPLCA